VAHGLEDAQAVTKQPAELLGQCLCLCSVTTCADAHSIACHLNSWAVGCEDFSVGQLLASIFAQQGSVNLKQEK
jgi:hypothetical protein